MPKRIIPKNCLDRLAPSNSEFGLLPTSRQAASTSAHRKSPEPSLVIFMSLDFLSPALPYHRHQSRVGADSLGVAESADVSQLAEHHLGRHGAHPRGGLEDLPGLGFPLCALATKALSFLLTARR